MLTDTLILRPEDNARLIRLCGPLDRHLTCVSDWLSVTIQRHNQTFTIAGTPANIALTKAALHLMWTQAAHTPLEEDSLFGLIQQAKTHVPLTHPVTLTLKKMRITGRTHHQNLYLKRLHTHDINFGIGPAGTGKTYLAVATAVEALEKQLVSRIVLVRPAVEAGEHLGFLPGDLAQKVDPYLRPLYDALYDCLGADVVARLIERQVIEVAPLAYMRGRTLNHAVVILDESQNTTQQQMKMFLTRLGFHAKAIITGDVTQVDLPKTTPSGLVQAIRLLQDIPQIGFTYFGPEDVVRHPLVQRIIEAYEQSTETASHRVS